MGVCILFPVLSREVICLNRLLWILTVCDRHGWGA